jgi:hypothetical protein
MATTSAKPRGTIVPAAFAHPSHARRLGRIGRVHQPGAPVGRSCLPPLDRQLVTVPARAPSSASLKTPGVLSKRLLNSSTERRASVSFRNLEIYDRAGLVEEELGGSLGRQGAHHPGAGFSPSLAVCAEASRAFHAAMVGAASDAH